MNLEEILQDWADVGKKLGLEETLTPSLLVVSRFFAHGDEFIGPYFWPSEEATCELA